MKLRNCTVNEFARRTADKKVICFGAYVMPLSLCNEFEEHHFEDRIVYLADNDKKKQGRDFGLPNRRTAKVLSAEQLAEAADEHTVLIITSDYFAAIIEQLDQYHELDDIDCYIYPFMKYDMEYARHVPVRHSEQPLIPKKIHYFWFGRNPKTELMEKCIDSWKKYCTDYEIIEWNEDNYDVTKHPFMKEAYDAGKYSFVSDFARLDIINTYGGIYFDTDVEVIKNIDDMLYNEAFYGLGCYGRIATGLGFGSVKGQEVVRSLVEAYDHFSFRNDHGDLNLDTNTIREEPIFKQLGLKQKNKFQTIRGASVFPSEFMSPCIPGFHTYRISNHTISIHHNRFSWADEKQMEEFRRSGEEYDRIRYRFEHD